jgi:hypothetical protein
MTEAEWLAADDPMVLLAYLRSVDRLSGRKARLFVAACCRRLWERIGDHRGRAAIHAAERYADEEADGEALLAAAREANEACYTPDGEIPREGAALSAAHLSTYAPHTLEAFTNPPDRARPGFGGYAPEAFAREEDFAALACMDAADAVAAGSMAGAAWEMAAGREFQRQAELLRDIFGSLFWPCVPYGAWKSPLAVSLAQAAYHERELPSGHLDVARLGVLSDALEEAGCADESILSHFRSLGPHVRGCWALDLVLAKR